MTDTKSLMLALGYTFNNLALLELALTHRSLRASNNERLEFLGDSILNTVVAFELYRRFPKASEGQLTRMRAHLICAERLTEIAKTCHLGDHIILGTGELRSGGHQRASILADAVEAIIGAIYLDSNSQVTADLSIVQQVILGWYEEKFVQFNDKTAQNSKDPKTVLQEFLQAQKLSLPEYAITRVEGEKHEQVFYVQCKTVLSKDSVIGIGNNRRKAEQMAAQLMLEKLKHVSKK